MKIVFDWAIPCMCVAVIIGLPLLWRPPRATPRRGPDKFDALIRDARDWPHESYAWGPGADQPVTGVDFYECGCSVVIDTEVATLVRCPAHEAMAEVERLTDGSER